MTRETTWREPPKPKIGAPSRPHPELAAFVDDLRSHPGEWAVYPRPLSNDSARTTATLIRRAVTRTWEPVGAFEATTRTEDGRVLLYVRYVGEPEAGAA